MIILSCETSTLLGSVAVLEDGAVIGYEESMRQGSHSDMLNIFIEKALAQAQRKLSDVDVFVSGIGPGSFTGIRISLNTIKSFGYCYRKPVIGVNSLKTLALENIKTVSGTEYEKCPVISMINAYKNMAYVSTHQLKNGELIELKAPEVVRVQNLSGYITEESVICGDAFKTYEAYLTSELKSKMIRPAQVVDEPTAAAAARWAHDHLETKQNWNELIPLYLRASEAEENLKGIKYQPLN